MSGGVINLLDKTHNSNLPGGATTAQVSKSFYDPIGLLGGGGDQLFSKIGLTGKGKTPDVVDTAVVSSSPRADAAKAAADAAAAANTSTAETKRRRANSSLSATGGRGVTGAASTSSSLAYGKPTLGA